MGYFGLGVACAVIVYPVGVRGQVVEGATGDTNRAISRALALLPQRPVRIIVIERARAIRLQPALSRSAEAFVPTHDTTIYLIQQGDTLQHAALRGGIFDYALAITIWHEMAHVAGATEREAQEREEALWQQFIVQGRVDSNRGFAYMALLKRRRVASAHAP